MSRSEAWVWSLDADEVVEALQRLLADGALGMVWGEGTAVVGANQTFLKLVGRTADDLAEGRIGWAQMTPPEWSAFDEAAQVDMASRGVSGPIFKEYAHSDGSRVPVLVAGVQLEAVPFRWLAVVLGLRTPEPVAERLAVREGWFQSVLDVLAAPLVVWQTVPADGDGLADFAVVYCNPAAADPDGPLGPLSVGGQLGAVAWEHRIEGLLEACRHVAATGRSHRGEHQVAGSGQVVETRVEAFGGGLLLSWHDLTPIQQRQQHRFRTVVDTLLHPLVVWDAVRASGQIVDFVARYANPAACETTGIPSERYIGASMRELLPSHLGTGLFDAYRQVVETGEPYRTEAIDYVDETDGTAHIAGAFDLQAAKVDDGFVVSFEDITERLQADAERDRALQQLRVEQGRFRSIADNSRDVVFRYRLDPPGLVYVSPSVQALTGHTPEQLLADPALLASLLPEEFDGMGVDPDGRPTGLRTTVPVVGVDEEPRWVEINTTVVAGPDGDPVAVDGIVRDVTTQQRTQQALEHALEEEHEAIAHMQGTEEVKDRLMTTLAHELRTPLTSVLGMAATLAQSDQNLDSGQRTNLAERIVANAERLADLLDKLTDMGRYLAGSTVPVPRRADLAALVEAFTDDVELPDHQLVVTTRPVEVEVDLAMLRRILHHLIDNAARYSPPGTIEMDVHPNGEHAHLTITDHGPGVPDTLHPQIFEPFEHGPSAADHAPGLGVGLTLTRQLLALHDGRIWVDTGPDGGAAFHLQLPRADRHTPRSARAKRTAHGP